MRDLSIDIPHPLNDMYTGEEGIAVFKRTDARSFVLSGSHRNTNADDSCQGSSYKIADAAQNINTFQSSVEAIMQFYEL